MQQSFFRNQTFSKLAGHAQPGTGFQHLQLNKSSKYRRNAVFFCQISLLFMLYMLYNY